MNRRELLERVAWMMGGAISAPAIMGILQGCSAKHEATWQPAFLSESQGAVVADVADLMIPRTETPGAIDVGVPAFIDTMLKDVYPADAQKRFLDGIAPFQAQAMQQTGTDYLKLKADQRMTFIQTLHDEAVAAERALKDAGEKPIRPFILMVKELTLLGFFTSEPGATQVLQYVAVPTAYHGCIPLSQAGNGKTWAT
jgi:gluconate 2-dehydrogenase gamma chain